MAAYAEPGSTDALRKARSLIEAIKSRHARIAHTFHSDAGARLMRIDSDMAEAVLVRLIIGQGIETLPVHDSFIVQASKRDLLEAAMVAAAWDVAKATVEIRISER